MTRRKACAVVTRVRDDQADILAFRHPQAKSQLVKGTIDPEEDPADAVCRELFEESGLVATKNPKLLLVDHASIDHNTWYFFHCKVPQPIPETWDHQALDDSGHIFSFFWHPIEAGLDEAWHPVFHRAFEVLEPKLIDEL